LQHIFAILVVIDAVAFIEAFCQEGSIMQLPISEKALKMVFRDDHMANEFFNIQRQFFCPLSVKSSPPQELGKTSAMHLPGKNSLHRELSNHPSNLYIVDTAKSDVPRESDMVGALRSEMPAIPLLTSSQPSSSPLNSNTSP
jgi:hypothetical protein